MWAEEIAQSVIKTRGKKQVVHCMITPSGPVHLGNLREVMTAHLVSQALKKKGAQVEFHFLSDNFDHLRRVYPFLPKAYEKYVGVPLSEVPAPKGNGTYDQYFLRPFLNSLGVLCIKPKIFYVSQLYKKGAYAPLIKEALKNREKIVAILSGVSGRKLEKDWSPFMPLCGKCGKINKTQVTGQNLKENKVSYQCECGHTGEANFSKGQGKLVWRIHWPATWKIFDVSVEGFGKDHATKGGSYEAGKEIIERVFKGKAPYPIPYEWIYIKGKGPMASSTGIGFTVSEMLDILPPEILTYFYERSKPNKHTHFDPKELSQLWNEYGGLSGISFEHLTTTIQSFDNKEMILDSLKRTGQIKNKKQIEKIKEEIKYIKNWLKKYAPERIKFEIQEQLPKVKLSKKQKEFLSNILDVVETQKLDGQKLHEKIHEIKKKMDINPKDAFSAIYLIFLGQESGPQAGWFLAGLDREFMRKRLRQAIKV